ncbi:Eco29kI family restriction endonuclease [Streptomyces sp. NRRL S-237]|uniref:Eco29kI family restriction endonuclease n=1 Tax=Streptomyces sp. NRRL S-237 TaxID=1463895 RepID=UPI001F418A21|nr:Eco29kI family restriction endonuclease [Streptomyces sp. NRRL S-237]
MITSSLFEAWAEAEPPLAPKRKKPKPSGWMKGAQRHPEYNPLELENLGRSVEAQLLRRAIEPLASVAPTLGAGVYAIYYSGPHPLYAYLTQRFGVTPIYVGQARREGERKGNTDPDADTRALFDRLEEHKDSIQQVSRLDPDLDIKYFHARYLVAIEAFVSVAERAMIKHHQPVWNTVVDGFGNHNPGVGRYDKQARPAWDELHPGRWWSHPKRMPKPNAKTPEESRIAIKAHFPNIPTQPIAQETATAALGADIVPSVVIAQPAV